MKAQVRMKKVVLMMNQKAQIEQVQIKNQLMY